VGWLELDHVQRHGDHAPRGGHAADGVALVDAIIALCDAIIVLNDAAIALCDDVIALCDARIKMCAIVIVVCDAVIALCDALTKMCDAVRGSYCAAMSTEAMMTTLFSWNTFVVSCKTHRVTQLIPIEQHSKIAPLRRNRICKKVIFVYFQVAQLVQSDNRIEKDRPL
jgi:hypothetical protein